MKKSGIFLLLVVMFMFFSLPLIPAQPPQATQIVINLETGYSIVPPQIFIHEVSQPIHLHFHVFNISNGVRVNNDSVNCSFELFNKSGDHLFQIEELAFTDNEWEIVIREGNFSTLGTYSYITECNDISIGGFISVDFEVTKTGLELKTSESIVYLLMIFGVLILFLLSFYFMISTPYSNKIDRKGAVIKITKLKYVKLGLILLTWVLFTWILNVLIGLSDNFISLPMYYGFFGFMFDVMNRLALPLGILIIVIALFEIWKDVNIQKAISKFGSSN